MRRLMLPLMLFVAAACQPATMELTDAQRTEIADEFRQFRMDLYASNERLDVEATLNAIGEDVALIVEGTRVSYEQFAPGVRAGFGALASVSVDVREMEIDVLAAHAVVNTDMIDEVATDTSSNRFEQTYLHTEVWVKRDGQWVMVAGQRSIPPQ